MADVRVHPFLMFQGGTAEAAMNFYVSLFTGSRIVDIVRFGPGEPGAEGSIKTGRIAIGGQTVMCFDSPVQHAFTFTPSISLFVDCESEAEIERLNEALLDGGEALMPIGEYGFSTRFAWIKDRFGVSWQLNLK
jgi:predicted 3-demethylubiquinone-9 3-methyltransferase (glyoxalase superfamily)